MGNKDKVDSVFCLNATTGDEIWHYSYPCGPGSTCFGPRATPTVDGNAVYTVSLEGHLFCLDAKSGTVKWEKNLISDLHAKNIGWGFSGSAVTDGNLLLVNAGLYGAALDKATGTPVWSSPADSMGGYSTPVVFTCDGKACLAVFGQKAVYAVDLKSGKEMWSYKWETGFDVNAADPIVVKDRMFISSGYDRGCTLLEFTAASVKAAWENKSMRSHFNSCVVLNGFLYGIDGNNGKGDLVCLDFATGQERWRSKIGFGSVTAADGKLIVLNEAGDLFVAQAVPEGYKELASAKGVLPRTCWTVPVLANGRLYCRNEKGDLVCLDVGK